MSLGTQLLWSKIIQAQITGPRIEKDRASMSWSALRAQGEKSFEELKGNIKKDIDLGRLAENYQLPLAHTNSFRLTWLFSSKDYQGSPFDSKRNIDIYHPHFWVWHDFTQWLSKNGLSYQIFENKSYDNDLRLKIRPRLDTPALLRLP